MQNDHAYSRLHAAGAIALIVLPLLLALLKLTYGPHWLLASTSLEQLPKHARRHVDYLMFVPLSLLIVAFLRLTLGIKVLSIFRPALLAIAFKRIGIPLGLLFLATALGTVVALQPLLRKRHYYERVPVTAVVVVSLMVTALIGFEHWPGGWMLQLAYFPVIALCLTCESFASALAKSGPAHALWLVLTTTAVGTIVMVISLIPGFMALLARCPELLIAHAGAVLLIGDRFHYRIFESFNPLRTTRVSEQPSEVDLSARVAVVETNA